MRLQSFRCSLDDDPLFVEADAPQYMLWRDKRNLPRDSETPGSLRHGLNDGKLWPVRLPPLKSDSPEAKYALDGDDECSEHYCEKQ